MKQENKQEGLAGVIKPKDCTGPTAMTAGEPVTYVIKRPLSLDGHEDVRPAGSEVGTVTTDEVINAIWLADAIRNGKVITQEAYTRIYSS